MFGIGMTELLVILVIALIVIGPEKLPELAKSLGKGIVEFKKAAEDFQKSIYTDIEKDKSAKGHTHTNDQGREVEIADELPSSDEHHGDKKTTNGSSSGNISEDDSKHKEKEDS